MIRTGCHKNATFIEFVLLLKMDRLESTVFPGKKSPFCYMLIRETHELYNLLKSLSKSPSIDHLVNEWF